MTDIKENIEEYNIIEKIFGENNILLCGDKFQTIYEWRGSTPNEIQNKFEKKAIRKGYYNGIDGILYERKNEKDSSN